jgi:RNA-binding protein
LYSNSCDISQLPRRSQYLTGLGKPNGRGLPELEVVSAKISAIVHATEDLDRVLQALSNLFPERSLPSRAETRRFHGHYGNEIRMVDLSIRGTQARTFFEYLWKSLPSFDRASILDALDKHLDSGGGLHLRLDKEDAFRGILRLKEQDPIKIHLSFQRRIKSDLEPNGEIKRFLESFENSSRNPTDHFKSES